MQKSLVITGAALGFLVLGVLGVHSAKFVNERDANNIRQAIVRYDIAHPVVNDHEFRIWSSYAVRAWPTLVVMDPSGYVIGSVSGEGHFEVLDHVISELVQSARARRALDERPRQWRLEKDTGPPSLLAFPGKVVADLSTDEVTALKLSGLAMPTAIADVEGMAWMDGETIILPPHSLKAGAEGQLVLHFELPSGYQLNPAAPVHYAVHVHGEGIHVANSGRPQSAHVIELPLTIPFRTMLGIYQASLDVEATFYWCRDDNTGVCMIHAARWHVPVDTSEVGGQQSITLSTTAQLQDVAGAPLPPSPPLGYKGERTP